jgi:hypothetical protein
MRAWCCPGSEERGEGGQARGAWAAASPEPRARFSPRRLAVKSVRTIQVGSRALVLLLRALAESLSSRFFLYFSAWFPAPEVHLEYSLLILHNIHRLGLWIDRKLKTTKISFFRIGLLETKIPSS